MANAQEQEYKSWADSFAINYPRFVPETIKTGAEISADIIGNTRLFNQWFYTANVPLATKRNGKLLLGIGGNEAFNAVFGTDTNAVCIELLGREYIHLTPQKRDLIFRLEQSGDVVFVDPHEMGLEGEEERYRTFSISTKDYKKDLTEARMPFVNAGYGSGDGLEQLMRQPNLARKINRLVIRTMSPYHAACCVEEGEIVAQACRLLYSTEAPYLSHFDASFSHVGNGNVMCGVPKDIDKSVSRAYHALESSVRV